MTGNTDKHALIALGANLPHAGLDAATTLRAALACLKQEGLQVQRLSPFFATPCFPAGAGPDYVNAAAQIVVPSAMSAQDLLAVLHRVEARFGRERLKRWGGRTLDLDLLALDDQVLPNAEMHTYWRNLPADAQAERAPEQLILPHPRMQDRAFVLVPLALVAADWRHPVLGETVAEMLQKLPLSDIEAVKSL